MRLVTGVIVLAALLAVLARAAQARSRRAAWALLLLSGLWFAADQPLEGPTLFVYSPTHGLTLADLLSGVGAFVALAVLMPDAWHASSHSPTGERVWRLLTVLALGETILALGVLFDLSLG